MARLIFLTGGVCSSVGKCIAIASIAAYIKDLGFTVKVKKCDPYLNIDPGTLSPYQHGEVFVTADGVEGTNFLMRLLGRVLLTVYNVHNFGHLISAEICKTYISNIPPIQLPMSKLLYNMAALS